MSTVTLGLPRAALAQTASPAMSPRYIHVNTLSVVRAIEAEGYKVHASRITSPRSRDPLFAKHMIEFRNPSHVVKAFGDVEPRIVFINSHDGSSRASLSAGLYRMVCSNGMIAQSASIDAASTRHAGDAAADLIERARRMARNTAPLFEKIERWSEIDLTRTQRHAFARMAAQLRWGDPERFSAEEILRVRRAGDDAGDLWSTFNRIQESTVRGGLSGMSRSGRQATSRPIADFSRDVDYNARLWQLTEELAEAF